jgi:hypothetical protein
MGIRKLIIPITALALLVPATARAAAVVDVPFAQAVFAATHNSYSGNLAGGARGSIAHQLDTGVRFVEFDVWDKLDSGQRGYFIGHNGPGNEVDTTGGNPSTNVLGDWLEVVAGWSDQNHGHAPITVALDMKDDITDDNYSFALANPAALNKTLTDVFGDKLVLAGTRDYDQNPLPNVSQLRDKVIVVLSGNQQTRTLYRRDAGATPAVAMNSAGKVVEVHQSNTNDYLWSWTGTYGSDGSIRWDRHTRYDTGRTPAVAVGADGTVVEVHKSQNNSGLYYHVGKLGADNEIAWGASVKYDTGATPAVAFDDNGDVVEVHSSGSDLYRRVGTVSGTQITWGAAVRTDQPLDKTTATSGTRSVRISTDATILRYTTDRVASARVQYQQVAFTEYQAGDNAELRTNTVYWASVASNKTFLSQALAAGKAVRGWDFESYTAGDPLPGFPATNHPDATWYRQALLTSPDHVDY